MKQSQNKGVAYEMFCKIKSTSIWMPMELPKTAKAKTKLSSSN